MSGDLISRLMEPYANPQTDKLTYEAALEISRLTQALEEAERALEVFIADEVDYMIRNKLGDPEKQHRVILGRTALTRIRAAKGGE